MHDHGILADAHCLGFAVKDRFLSHSSTLAVLQYVSGNADFATYHLFKLLCLVSVLPVDWILVRASTLVAVSSIQHHWI